MYQQFQNSNDPSEFNPFQLNSDDDEANRSGHRRIGSSASLPVPVRPGEPIYGTAHRRQTGAHMSATQTTSAYNADAYGPLSQQTSSAAVSAKPTNRTYLTAASGLRPPAHTAPFVTTASTALYRNPYAPSKFLPIEPVAIPINASAAVPRHSTSLPPQVLLNSRIPGLTPPSKSRYGEKDPAHDHGALDYVPQPAANTLTVNGVPVPPHQQYYPRSAWGPPPERREVELRLLQREQAQKDARHAIVTRMNYDDIDPALRNPTHGDLDFLADGYEADQKPPYSYTTIIKFSILGSPRGKLTLTELCETIQARFPYYTTTENDWRNSVRHTLSLSGCFRRLRRPAAEAGKGDYWTYDPGVNADKKRVRKKQNYKVKSNQIEAALLAPRESDLQDAVLRSPNEESEEATGYMSVTSRHTRENSISSMQSSGTGASSSRARINRSDYADFPRDAEDDDYDNESGDVDREVATLAFGDFTSSLPLPRGRSSSTTGEGPSPQERGEVLSHDYSSSEEHASSRDSWRGSKRTRRRETSASASATGSAVTTSERRDTSVDDELLEAHTMELDDRYSSEQANATMSPAAVTSGHSPRPSMTPEEVEAEELRKRDLGELVALREARKRKEMDSPASSYDQDSRGPSRGTGKSNRAPQASSGDPPASNTNLTGLAARTSRRKPVNRGPSPIAINHPGARMNLYTRTHPSHHTPTAPIPLEAAHANKYLPRQRVPPPQEQATNRQIQTQFAMINRLQPPVVGDRTGLEAWNVFPSPPVAKSPGPPPSNAARAIARPIPPVQVKPLPKPRAVPPLMKPILNASIRAALATPDFERSIPSSSSPNRSPATPKNVPPTSPNIHPVKSTLTARSRAAQSLTPQSPVTGGAPIVASPAAQADSLSPSPMPSSDHPSFRSAAGDILTSSSSGILSAAATSSSKTIARRQTIIDTNAPSPSTQPQQLHLHDEKFKDAHGNELWVTDATRAQWASSLPPDTFPRDSAGRLIIPRDRETNARVAKFLARLMRKESERERGQKI